LAQAASMASLVDDNAPAEQWGIAIEQLAASAALGRSHLFLIIDADQIVRAASTAGADWVGRPIDSFIAGGQPLTLFGERAGVLKVSIGDRPFLAAADLVEERRGVAVALIAQDAVFAQWRDAATFNIMLYVATAAVLLIILYAYFSQAARAQTADRLYLAAHERVDMALVRGRCGLWDWDMVRGRMYWSRSMYDMLGYEPSDALLSFGAVAEIVHPEDADLFEVANRIVAREVDQIDKVFRMRHAEGQW